MRPVNVLAAIEHARVGSLPGKAAASINAILRAATDFARDQFHRRPAPRRPPVRRAAAARILSFIV